MLNFLLEMKNHTSRTIKFLKVGNNNKIVYYITISNIMHLYTIIYSISA